MDTHFETGIIYPASFMGPAPKDEYEWEDIDPDLELLQEFEDRQKDRTVEAVEL